MFFRNLFFIASLCTSLVAVADELTNSAPMSSWHTASAVDKKQLIGAVSNQLQASAQLRNKVAVPTDAVASCVDKANMADEVKVKDHTVKVTAALAVMVCLKTFVPELRKARYQMEPPSP